MHSSSLYTSVWRRLFNIAPQEGGRVLHGWVLRFFFQWGYILGWTLVTAMVVTHFGIQGLPYFYVLHGILIILGTYGFSHLITFCSQKTLVLYTAGSGAFLLSLALLFAEYSQVFFIMALILVVSVFSSQLHILLMAYVEELFSPLEFERLNPIVETAEPLGGVAGGLSFVLLVGVMRPEGFVYLWVLALCVLIPVYVGIRVRKRLPRVKNVHEHHTMKAKVGAIPFVRLLALVILLQWMYMNILGYQYTSAVDSFVVHVTHADLSGGERLLADASELTHGLGTFHLLFSLGMLLVQLFLSSRIMTRLGVVRTMMLLPVVNALTSLGLFFSFGIASAVTAKGFYEAALVTFNNGYHTSYYAFYEHIREQVREFLEGGIRSLGMILGTMVLIGAQVWVTALLLPQVLSLVLFGISVLMVGVLWYMRDAYTHVAAQGLDMPGVHPDKISAIEILTQQGHSEAEDMLGNVLLYKQEPVVVQVELVRALGRIGKGSSLPDLLLMLRSPHSEVQIAALESIGALCAFQERGMMQAFTRHRVVHTLSDLFVETTDEEVRSAVMQTFGTIRHPDVVELLIRTLETASVEARATIISIIGTFGDPSSVFYLQKYLKDRSPTVRARTIIALWQFKKYRLKLLTPLLALLESERPSMLLAGVLVVGEVRAFQEHERLLGLMNHIDQDIRRGVVVALAQMGTQEALAPLAYLLVFGNRARAKKTYQQLRVLSPKMKRSLRTHVFHLLYPLVRERFGDVSFVDIRVCSSQDREDLAYYYEILGEMGELLKVRHYVQEAIK